MSHNLLTQTVQRSNDGNLRHATLIFLIALQVNDMWDMGREAPLPKIIIVTGVKISIEGRIRAVCLGNPFSFELLE